MTAALRGLAGNGDSRTPRTDVTRKLQLSQYQATPEPETTSEACRKNWTVARMKVNSAFQLDIKVLESAGRVKWHRNQGAEVESCGSPSSAGVDPLSFINF